MSRKRKTWRKVVSILMTVLIMVGGLAQNVFAEETSTTPAKTENSKQETSSENSKQETSTENSKQETSTENSKQETSTENSKQDTSIENSKQETSAESSKQETATESSKQETATESSKQETTEESKIQAAAKTDGRISGTLKQGGSPLTDVTFSIKSVDGDSWYDTTSDKDGEFGFDLPVGEFFLAGIWLPSEGKWYQLDQKISVVDNETTLDINLPAKLETNVKGTMTKDGQPLPNVTFSLHTTGEPERWYDDTTESDGQFGFILSDGEYKIDGIWVPSDEKWYKLGTTFKVTNGKLEGLENLNLDLKTEPSPVLNQVSGTLSEAGKPLADILFSLHTTKGEEEWYSTTSDQNGHFELNLPEGEYEIEGIWVPDKSKWHQLDKVFTVAGKTDLNLDLPSSPDPTKIKGTLTKQGVPLGNIPFSIHSNGEDAIWYDTKTDANGAFTLEGLSDGDYLLDGIWVEQESKWYVLQLKFTVENGKLSGSQELTVDISQQEKSIKGHVLKGDAPVSDVWVSAHTTGDENDTWYDVKTNQDGAFSFTIPDGNYAIEGIYISAEEKWYPQRVEFTVSNGGLVGQSEVLINLQAENSENVSGTVFDGQTPVANAALYMENTETGDFFGVDADENGQFTLELKDGNYSLVSVTSDDTYYLYKKFSVEKGKLLINKVEAKTLDVTIPPASLVIEVQSNGQQVTTDGVYVINDEHQYGYWGYEDESGKIAYRLVDGTYTVQGYYGADGFFQYINKTVTIENGTTNPSPLIINVETETKDQLSGVVRNDAGVVPNASFYIVEKDYNWQYLVEADAAGSYSVNVPDGEYYISDIYSGSNLYGIVDVSFKVDAGKVYVNDKEVDQFDIVVPAKTLNGKLLNGGAPIAGDFYFQREINGSTYEYTGSTNSQGVFSLRVPDGNYTITTVYGNGTWYDVNRTIEVVNGTTDPNPFVIDTAQGNVTGSVKNAAGAIADAEFFIEKVGSSSYYWVISDGNGKFSTNIPDGDYFIHQVWGGDLPSNQYADEFFSVIKGKVKRNGVQVEEVSLNLPGESLKAKMVNHSTPLAGEVFIKQKVNEVTFEYSAALDANGEFSLRVPDGTYSITRLFTTDNVYDINIDVVVKNGATTPSPYVIDISNGAAILQGVVQDEKGVISNGTITMERYTSSGYDGWYDAKITNGEFSTDLPDGTYKVVEVEEDNGIVTLLDQDFSIEDSKLMVDGAPAAKLTVSLPAITLKGTLWDGDTQVQSAELFVIKNNDDGSIYAYTNEHGVFEARLPDGSYTVEEAYLANKERIMLNQSFDIISGKLSVDGAEISSLELHLPTVNVSGKLSDGQNDLAEHYLTVFDADGNYFSALTASNGSFQFRLPDGEYKVHEAKYFSETNDYVNYPLQTAFTIADGKLEVKGAPADQLTITLPPVTLNAIIVDGSDPVAHANLRFVRELDGQFTYFYAMTDENGRVSYRLPDGTYTLENTTFSNGESVDLTQEIKVENGTTTPAPLIIDVH